MVINKKVVDRLICYLVSFMIMSFYLFEMKSWGRYVLIVITALVTLLFWWQENRVIINIKVRPFHKHIVIFSIYCLASGLWAWNPSLAISKSITILSILLCFSLLYSYYQRQGNIDSLLKSIMLAGYGISIYTIFYYGPSTIMEMATNGLRIDNDYTNANSIGQVSAISCIIQFYYILTKRANLSVIFIIPSILTLAISQSRKAMVMFVIGIIVLAVSGGRRKGIVKKLIRIITGIIFSITIIYLLSQLDIFDGLMRRFETYYESLTGARAINIRDVFRQIGIKQFYKTPILGIGIGNSAELLESEGYRRTYLHDNFVELLSGGGIVGFLIFYSIYARLIVGLWKHRAKDPETTNLCLIFLVLLLIMDYGVVSYFKKQQYIFFMCFFLQLEIQKNLNKYKT